MSGSDSDGSGSGHDPGSGSGHGPEPGQSPDLAYEDIRVDADQLQSDEFKQLEAQLIADYEQKGYQLQSKTPLADVHRRSDGRAILTFSYIFQPIDTNKES